MYIIKLRTKKKKNDLQIAKREIGKRKVRVNREKREKTKA